MRRLPLLLLLAFTNLFLILPFAAAKDEWPPIVKEELAMKDYAASPGVAAVILRREDNENDVDAYEEHYFRIKILTEAGKKYADVETPPFLAGAFRVDGIKARTIEPDGSIVPFEGKAFDKVVAKRRGVQMLAKTWTMPDVRVGSIIEYRYTTRWDSGWVYRTRWTIQQDLPTRSAHFSFLPAKDFACAWLIMGLPAGQQPVKSKQQIVLDLENIAGVENEEFMPPLDEVRARVEFFYSQDTILTGDEYWKKEGGAWRNTAESFMDKNSASQRQVAGILGAGDTPEQKLRKIYAAAQKIRNLTYEREEKRDAEKLKDNSNVEDVYKHNYGYHNQINRAFAAMARAAGLEASLVRVAERDDVFFHKNIPSISQLSSEVVMVKVDGKQLYLDPGTLDCPFGVLPWEDTGVAGLLENKSGTSFVDTPYSRSEGATRRRTAKLELSREGTLSGTLELSYEGIEALERRLEERENDDKQRTKDMEDTVRAWLPSNAVVTLQSVNNWTSSDPELKAVFKISVTGFGDAAGSRLLLPTTVFQHAPRFTHAKRTNAIYFRYASRELDDISLTLPDSVEVDNLPAPKKNDQGAARYILNVTHEGNTIHMTREVGMDGVLFPVQYYPALRGFYANVKAGDEEPAILKAVRR